METRMAALGASLDALAARTEELVAATSWRARSADAFRVRAAEWQADVRRLAGQAVAVDDVLRARGALGSSP